MIRLNGRNCRAGVGQWDRRNRFCLSTYNKQCCIMSKQRNIDLSGNNSPQQPTAQPSEMGKYSTLELQAAFDAGRALGRTEGMLSYQRHIMNQLFAENQKLNRKLQEQKGGRS